MIKLEPSLDWAGMRTDVVTTGLTLLPAYLDVDFGMEIKCFIDSFDVSRSEINYGGTEKRVWMAHEKHEAIAAFRRFADELLSRMYGQRIASRNTLAIRNLPVEPAPGLIDGRWHLDSLRMQIKVFAFITDVNERSGPLEIVPRSHRWSFKLPHLIGGKLVQLSDFRGGNRKYQRLDDDWVARISAAGGSQPLVCPAGTVAVVDTSAIHRARPCLEGHRYALTSYYDRF